MEPSWERPPYRLRDLLRFSFHLIETDRDGLLQEERPLFNAPGLVALITSDQRDANHRRAPDLDLGGSPTRKSPKGEHSPFPSCLTRHEVHNRKERLQHSEKLLGSA